MSRRKVLASFLFVAACGDDGVHHLADAPPAQLDAGGPGATYATSLAMTSTCGDPAPASLKLTITNPGTAALYIDAFTVTGGFVIEGLDADHPLVIQPAGTGDLTVYPPLAVIGTDLPAQVKTGTLGLSSNIFGGIPDIALSTTIMGAALAVVDATDTPQPLAFAADNTCPAPLATFLRNTGNMPVTVNGPTSASGYLASAYSGGTLAPMTSQAAAFHLVTPASCSGTDTIDFAVTSAALCNGDSSGAHFSVGATFAIANASTCFCS